MTENEHSDIQPESLRRQTFKLLEKHHDLKSKELCKLMNLPYLRYHDIIQQYRQQWKSEYKNRQALKCLSFHNTRGWIYALKVVSRDLAVERFWVQTRARNRMLLWKDKFGRLEWHLSGRINVWVKKPATWGRLKQLLANAFFSTGLIKDVQIFDLWADTLRLKGSHLVYDTGERLPYARIDYLKESLGAVVKTGDITHPTGIEIEFTYPDFAERNEKLLEQNMRALEQFTEFLKGLSQPKPLTGDASKMVV